jgi:hypothetical protein
VAPQFCSISSSANNEEEGLIDIRVDFASGCNNLSTVCCPLTSLLTEPKPPSHSSGQSKNTGCGYGMDNGASKFPWTVEVIHRQVIDDSFSYHELCNGTLIHPSVILIGNINF